MNKNYRTDFTTLREQSKLQGMRLGRRKKGWRTDIDKAPVGVFLLLRESEHSHRIYRATLERNKKGEMERGFCDAPWIAPRPEDNEMFIRDAIREWFNPEDENHYLREIKKAERLQKAPVCKRRKPKTKITSRKG